jgi:hypothetical protein
LDFATPSGSHCNVEAASLKSIVQPEGRQCFLCGRQAALERHHILGGSANRKLSEHYGLWCYLCASCHRGVDGAQYNSEKGLYLKRLAQKAFEEKYSHAFWMETFRKNYI